MFVSFLSAVRDSFSSMIGKDFSSSASYLGVALEGASFLSPSAFFLSLPCYCQCYPPEHQENAARLLLEFYFHLIQALLWGYNCR